VIAQQHNPAALNGHEWVPHLRRETGVPGELARWGGEAAKVGIRAQREPFCLRARIQPCQNDGEGKGALAPEGTLHPTSHPESGLTLVELIIVVAILSVLATAAVPIARFTVRREKERELRRDLWEMRAAIDRYKDAADKGAFQIKADSMGYPPDLDTLVNGVEAQGKKVRFLRKIPTDPMTGNTDWGLRSNQDDPESDSFGGQNVFDVHSKSTGTALDGTKYSTW
jgi:general secretion pathway protein G